MSKKIFTTVTAVILLLLLLVTSSLTHWARREDERARISVGAYRDIERLRAHEARIALLEESDALKRAKFLLNELIIENKIMCDLRLRMLFERNLSMRKKFQVSAERAWTRSRLISAEFQGDPWMECKKMIPIANSIRFYIRWNLERLDKCYE